MSSPRQTVIKKFTSTQFSDMAKAKCESPNFLLQYSRPLNQNDSLRHTSPDSVLLGRLRRRKASNKSLDISPKVAVEVIKDYLLPMFRNENRTIRDKNRAKVFNNQSKKEQKKIDTSPGTVYAELKLSEQLFYENQELEKKCQSYESLYKDIFQEKCVIEEKFKLLKNDFFHLECEYKALMFLNQETMSMANYKEQSFFFIKSQCDKYLKIYKEVKEKLDEKYQAVHEERLINDIRLL